MVPDSVGVGPGHEEMFWNHTPNFKYQEKSNFFIGRIKVH